MESAGRPDIHLIFEKPEKDTNLQKAIKAERVITVFQPVRGSKADYGEPGFHPGASRQYLIFPRSVRAFSGCRVVGIDFDLLTALPASTKTKRPAPATRKKPAKSGGRTRSTRAKMRRAADIPPGKLVKFPGGCRQAGAARAEEDEAIEELKSQVRKAMAELEMGKQVAAFNLLKTIIGE